MSTDDRAPAISSKSEFAVELNALLGRAHENGIDVEGGWECRNGDGQPAWDVVVTEMADRDGPD